MLPTERLPITIDGPPVPLLLHWMTGHEELGRPFAYELEIFSEKMDLGLDTLLGKPMTVCLAKLGGVRFFNGIVTRLWRVGTTSRYLVLRAVLSPKLWLLGRTTDCRIYQKKSVPDVVKEVLREHAITFSTRLQDGDYTPWDYLTQYRESDLAFVSRIMEREGIYYYFKHTQTAHEMVLADSASSHYPRPSYEQVPIWSAGTAQAERDHFTSFKLVSEVTSIGATLQAHDFRLRRGANLTAIAGTAAEHEHDEFQLYDYPGHYVGSQNQEAADAGVIRTAGEHYARARLDERRSDLERIEAEGNPAGIETGAVFQLDDLGAPTDKLLVVGTNHELRNAAFESSGEGIGEREICQMACVALNLKRQFRPTQSSDGPRAIGPETAIVVGPKGEEIYTDKYGRVRVQFYWDREGQLDENSTCWVRVGQMWAGANWGSIYIPRVGQEVIVQFLGGDPDRPIVMGGVYNADNMPPYTLPDNATQSGIKSRSSKGGAPSNFNELRFEDKKGDEEVFIQAEKNKTVNVKNNRAATIGANDTISVGGDRSVTVTGNLSVTVKGGGNSPDNSLHTVTGKHRLHASDTIDADAPTHVKLSCGSSFVLIEPGKITVQVGGGAQIVLDANVAIDGATVTATGKTEATLTAASTVKATPAGVEVTGPTVKING